METRLSILYRDASLVAVSKPAGLLVHRSEIDRRETRFAVQMLRDQLGSRVYPLHRLDRPTSGVLLFALTPEVARRMGVLFEQRRVQKQYLAVVRGWGPDRCCLDYPLREMLDRTTDSLADPDKPPQEARTCFRTIARIELPYGTGRYPTSRYSLVEAVPHTGRKHQIRRHLKHLFHPIVGDTTYGDGAHNRLFREQLQCRRMLLAATQLRFPHPENDDEIVVRAPLEGDFMRIVQRIGWTREAGEVLG